MRYTDNEIDKIIGDELRKLREEKGLSQQYVADLLGEGVVRQTISKWENGSRTISASLFMMMLDIYGEDVEDFKKKVYKK